MEKVSESPSLETTDQNVNEKVSDDQEEASAIVDQSAAENVNEKVISSVGSSSLENNNEKCTTTSISPTGDHQVMIEDENKDKEEEEEGEEEEVSNSKMKRSESPDLLLNKGDSSSVTKGGGWKTMPYIIGNETFEKLASMSLIANMTVYLRAQYNMDGLSAVSVVNIWGGTCNLVTLMGAFISDAYLGRFRTLLYASFTYLLGMIIMTLTAAVPHLRPPGCNKEINSNSCKDPQKWQLAILFAGLVLLAVGAGGIRPCNIAFGIDQFDTTTKKGQKDVESFYNWYYWSFTLALIVALTVVVYIQNNISWAWGFAIPTAFIFLSIVVFVLGSRVYIYMKPKGSVFVGIAKVISAAFRKRKIRIKPVCDYPLYDNPSTDPLAEKPHLTDRFTCLTKAAVITELDRFNSEGRPVNGWRLCSVQQVEQFKCILSVMPVWASGVTCFIAMDQQSTQGVLQAIQTDTRLVSEFHVPPGSMAITSMIALSIWIPIYERLLQPLSRKMTKDGEGITLRHRLGAGIVMSILCMLVAGVVEGRRRELALKHNTFIAPMSFAWLIPQFVLSGMTEAFTGIGIMEFLGKQFPASMRTLAGSLFFLSLATGSYISSFLINLVHKITTSSKDGSPGWLGGRDLNKNKLDYYYYIVAGICVVNLVYYVTFASRYVHSNKVAAGKDIEMNQ